MPGDYMIMEFNCGQVKCTQDLNAAAEGFSAYII